jgi:hypothetical protein
MGTASSNGHPGRIADRDRLATSIADTRAELARALAELRGTVRDQLHWREWVRARPLLAVTLMAAVGWRLGRGRWV